MMLHTCQYSGSSCHRIIRHQIKFLFPFLALLLPQTVPLGSISTYSMFLQDHHLILHSSLKHLRIQINGSYYFCVQRIMLNCYVSMQHYANYLFERNNWITHVTTIQKDYGRLPHLNSKHHIAY